MPLKQASFLVPYVYYEVVGTITRWKLETHARWQFITELEAR